LKTLLNGFFTPITEIIFKHNDTIEKYVGDMVMAFWGAPLDDENHRGNAIKAALELMEKSRGAEVGIRGKRLPGGQCWLRYKFRFHECG